MWVSVVLADVTAPDQIRKNVKDAMENVNAHVAEGLEILLRVSPRHEERGAHSAASLDALCFQIRPRFNSLSLCSDRMNRESTLSLCLYFVAELEMNINKLGGKDQPTALEAAL